MASKILIAKKSLSKTEIEKQSNVKKKIVMTKQSSLKVVKQKGICINSVLNKNVISRIFGFFSCQDLLAIRFTCKIWNQGIISYIKLQTKFNPSIKKKNDMEDKHNRKHLEEEMAYIHPKLLKVYEQFDCLTPDEIYEADLMRVYPVLNLLFSLIIQFKLLCKMPRHQSLIESEDWRIGYVQVYIDKVILPLRITKEYTVRKFLRLFNKIDIQYFKAALNQIRFDFTNKIQYIPLLAKKIEIFLQEGIQFYEEYQKENPAIVEYMEVISELENNRKEIIIAKNICKRYSSQTQ